MAPASSTPTPRGLAPSKQQRASYQERPLFAVYPLTPFHEDFYDGRTFHILR